jgi:hypothetical protein
MPQGPVETLAADASKTITLADLDYYDLRAGMKFKHPHYGEQVILSLGRGELGRAVHFHNTDCYNGAMPQLGEIEGEETVFERIASKTYPNGAVDWEYLGMITPAEIESRGWQWFRVECPHCASTQYLLASSIPSGGQYCRGCGMVVQRPPEPSDQPEYAMARDQE